MSEQTNLESTGVKASDREIQGNLVGFNKDHQRLLFVDFPDAAAGRAFLNAMQHELANAEEVLAANAEYRRNVIEGGEDAQSRQDTWVNLVLSFSGLTTLAAPQLDAFPQEFRDGMRARSAAIGDVGNSDPRNWKQPFAGGNTVHAMVILAADDPRDLDDRTTTIRSIITTNGVNEASAEDGNVRPDGNRGHEHFGFRDGISQPGIKGWTKSSKGGDQIEPGEFVIGYANQDGHLSGGEQQNPPPQEGEPVTQGLALRLRRCLAGPRMARLSCIDDSRRTFLASNNS